MMSYDIGLLAPVPLLERLDFGEEGSLALRLKDLQVGDVRFLSGVVRTVTRGNGG